MTLKTVYLISSLDLVGLALLITAFDHYILSLGGSHLLTGTIGSVHALLQLLSNPVVGGLSDSKGRKPVLLRALAFSLLSNFLLGLTNSFIILFLARIVFGLASQTQILLKIIVADNTPKEEQASAFGKLGACGAIGFIVGPILGGHIYELNNGFFYICVMMSLITLINMALVFFLPDTPLKTKTSKENTTENKLLSKVTNELKKTFVNLININWKVYWDLFTLKLLIESAFSMFYASFAMVLTRTFLISQKHMGYTLALHSALVIAANLAIGHIRKKFYMQDDTGIKRILHGTMLLTISFIGFSISPSYWIYVLFLIPISAARCLMDSTWTEILLFRCKDKENGILIGAFESIMPLSGLVTPLLSGIAIHLWGNNAPAVLSLVPCLIGTLLAYTLSYTSAKGVKQM